jgi:hypothetical protein
MQKVVDVKTGSGMIDFRSVTSLVTTTMILRNNKLFFLTFCIDCSFYRCVSVYFSKTDGYFPICSLGLVWEHLSWARKKNVSLF